MTVDTRTKPADSPVAEPAKKRFSLPGWFGPWEFALLGLVVIVMIAGAVTSPFFATGENFAITAAGAVGLSLMVVPMAWLMIAEEIDLSIASVFGMCGVIFGLSIENGMPLALAIILAVVVGAIAGLINGFLTVDVGLPSLVVTVGTLALFRGIAFILLESRSVSDLPLEFTQFAQGNIPGTLIPNGFIVFLVVAIVAGIVLARGSAGRKTYAVGSSVEVSRFSGIRVKRVKRGLFIFSGSVAGLAGVLYAGYVSSARANNGTGLELSVIAIVLIGGVSMYGGKGSFIGVMLALLLVTTLTSWMTLGYVPTNIQYTVIGLLMIGAVVLPALISKFKNAVLRRRG
ncbi:ABC transporter permease [Herbiconiux daphne]|uniref:Autoinducer 2 import system permease protein LsrD n=1 Tax=Herbiconiux daphne TaxID=2970914 RepID=A0ABT2H514_9MICO|nr:ABC transporter permease [Herbiconiux daphne]MCS5735011.1 ABC transporter permease [Herbiconiux daphne]